MSSKVTIKQIAEMAGCSSSTVSRVINGQADKHRISKITQEKIQRIVQELNFSPSRVAQGLRTNRTNTIGLIIPDISNFFFAQLAKSIEREAFNRGYSIILADSEENPDIEIKLLDILANRSIDGLIIAPCGKNARHLMDYKTVDIPVVQIDRYFESVGFPYVATNNYLGAVMATEHLVNNGHKIIACIQGSTYSRANMERIRGFVNVLKDKGLTDKPIIVGDEYSIQNGFFETNIILREVVDKRPTAIFALSNQIAFGAIKAIRQAKLKIPDDISIITFDNNFYLEYLDPPISCIGQPINEMGQIATKILLRQIFDAEFNNIQQDVLLTPQIIQRKSVKSI